MKLRDCQDVADSPDAATLNRRLVWFANNLDFELITGALIVDRPSGRPVVHQCGHVPDRYRAAYESFENGLRDPVMKRMARLSVPFVYDQAMYVDEHAQDLWDFQAQFGFKTGVAYALHLPRGKRFTIGFDREQALPNDEAMVAQLMAALQLLAVHALEASLRSFELLSTHTTEPPRLSKRELEVLGWTFNGKTAWEVGMLLGISERTAAIHANNATHKLQCVSKHQAALKAMRIGLI